jgi:lysophospholipase L1-like esterase
MKKTLLMVLVTLATLTLGAQTRPTVAILGDSYSTFEGYNTPDTMEMWYFQKEDLKRTDVSQVRDTWWWQVVKEGGYKLGINDSWSGSTICNTSYGDRDESYKSFLRRMDALGTPDIIFIFGGTNDAWAQAPLGSFQYDQFRMADKYYFRPALAFMLSHMLDRYPNTRIYFISNSDLDEAYTSSIHTICKHYSVPVIQLHDISKQNGHPDKAGMKAIARQVLEAMNN